MDNLIDALGLLNEQIACDPTRTAALAQVVDLLNAVYEELGKVTPLKPIKPEVVQNK
jgi:hypothetical protein